MGPMSSPLPSASADEACAPKRSEIPTARDNFCTSRGLLIVPTRCFLNSIVVILPARWRPSPPYGSIHRISDPVERTLGSIWVSRITVSPAPSENPNRLRRPAGVHDACQRPKHPHPSDISDHSQTYLSKG